MTSEEGRDGLQDVVNLCRQESQSSGLPNDSKENEEPLIIQEAASSMKNVPESETKISFKIVVKFGVNSISCLLSSI